MEVETTPRGQNEDKARLAGERLLYLFIMYLFIIKENLDELERWIETGLCRILSSILRTLTTGTMLFRKGDPMNFCGLEKLM